MKDLNWYCLDPGRPGSTHVASLGQTGVLVRIGTTYRLHPWLKEGGWEPWNYRVPGDWARCVGAHRRGAFLSKEELEESHG